jgi:hypothetical protein
MVKAWVEENLSFSSPAPKKRGETNCFIGNAVNETKLVDSMYPRDSLDG